jgi:hypothetical protein
MTGERFALEEPNRRAFQERDPLSAVLHSLRGDGNMPAIFIMWAVPTIIVLGGISYYLLRAVQ